jgi:hypothetical protein
MRGHGRWTAEGQGAATQTYDIRLAGLLFPLAFFVARMQLRRHDVRHERATTCRKSQLVYTRTLTRHCVLPALRLRRQRTDTRVRCRCFQGNRCVNYEVLPHGVHAHAGNFQPNARSVSEAGSRNLQAKKGIRGVSSRQLEARILDCGCRL